MKDLREFVKLLHKQGQLALVDVPVDTELEITEITDRVCKAGGPALLFTKPKGFDIPVLTNQFGTLDRVCLGLGVRSLDELAQRVEQIAFPSFPDSAWKKLKALAKIKDLASLQPRIVKEGPCQEVVVIGDEVDLGNLPILKCWPEDAGRFITLPLVFTRHPDSGKRNVGMYRMQVYDRNTTGMHWHLHKDAARHFRASSENMPVAVAIGTDPTLTYAATAPLPGVLDEISFAGFLRGEAVDLVKCVTVDLEVPAEAEIVLEGYVRPGEMRLEGPFGDHTGFYSEPEYYPVFHVTAITHRKDPIYAATIVGRPPMEDAFLAKATERLFLPLLRMIVPEVVDIDLPAEGGFHNLALVSIRKEYPLQARKVMHALWGAGQMQFCKAIVIVDEDVNVHDYSEVAWRVLANVDWERDVVVVQGPLDALDHSSPYMYWGGKIGIDATRKREDEGHPRSWPKDIVMSPEIKARVDALWSQLRIPV